MHSKATSAIGRLTAAALMLGPSAAHTQPQPNSLVTAKPFACQVFASDRVDLASSVEGVLDKILVERGDLVRKGDVVATLHSEVERVNLALAQTRAKSTAQLRSKQQRFELESRKLERNLDLVRKNLVSPLDIDQMRADKEIAALDVTGAEEAIELARLEAERAAAQLEVRSIKAPVDGIVVERRLSAGELVRDKPVVIIAKIDPLYAEVSLPVAYLGEVKAGMLAKIAFDAPGVAPRTVPAALVDRVIEPTSNTFGVRFILSNTGNLIPSGSKCRVSFEPDNPSVAAQPQR